MQIFFNPQLQNVGLGFRLGFSVLGFRLGFRVTPKPCALFEAEKHEKQITTKLEHLNIALKPEQ